MTYHAWLLHFLIISLWPGWPDLSHMNSAVVLLASAAAGARNRNAFKNQASGFQLAVGVGHEKTNKQTKMLRSSLSWLKARYHRGLGIHFMEPNPANTPSLQPTVTACCFTAFERTDLFKALILCLSSFLHYRQLWQCSLEATKWKALCPDPLAKGRIEFACKVERTEDSLTLYSFIV